MICMLSPNYNKSKGERSSVSELMERLPLVSRVCVFYVTFMKEPVRES